MMKLINNGATFSACRKYRYALWRIWDDKKPLAMFVGLNPSTANESKDDPTIRRVRGIVEGWDYGGVYMLNLFAWISPYPGDLLSCPDPVGQNNDFLINLQARVNLVVFAWGSFPEAQERAKEVAAIFPSAQALVINKDGSPRHPLYVSRNPKPIPFNTK